MPVVEEIRTPEGILLIWETTEEIGELEQLCNAHNIDTRNSFNLEARIKQFLVTSLLHDRLFNGSELQYMSTGKPIVNNGDHISISHSGNMLVMMRSKTACGVDIERIHPRVEKVKHKFLADSELAVPENSGVFALTQLWTAKEAMFKVHGTDTVFMRSNIFIDIESPELARAKLIDEDLTIKRMIRFKTRDDMMLAWTESADEK